MILADRNFVARIVSYESRKKKFLSKTRFSLVLQTNFVARIITNFNSGVLRESCENFESNTNFSLWIMTLLVCESRKYETHKLRDSQASQYIAFFPSCETRKTRTDIFARRESHFSHFPQNSREKNCETRFAVNLSYSSTTDPNHDCSPLDSMYVRTLIFFGSELLFTFLAVQKCKPFL